LWLASRDDAAFYSPIIRQRALDLFDVAHIGPQWASFLGLPTFTATTNGVAVTASRQAVIDVATPPPDGTDAGLRIRHHVPHDHDRSVKRACIWCGRPTDVLAETPFRPDLGFLPLMVTCGAHMRIVYRMLQRGEQPDEWELSRVAALAQLEAITA
jgi:hypothetical protein